MKDLEQFEVWFITGSQDLYGEKTLRQVAVNSEEIVKFINNSSVIPVNLIFKSVLKTPDEITKIFNEANIKQNCIGVITWCHTFSPSKMWINGLKNLQKPLLHLHTQYNLELPWSEIDMDFMNLNQSAHGDREHGFIMTRMRKNRKVVVGHWMDEEVIRSIGIWTRVCAAWYDFQSLKVARFGDNMREVAVTEGDKVEAQIKFGVSVNGYGIGDLVKVINDVPEFKIINLVEEYNDIYKIGNIGTSNGKILENIRYQARIELGLRQFLENGGFKAFTTTFEDLHGLAQLPGLASQRLMAGGYGFGAEGDWKHRSSRKSFKSNGYRIEGRLFIYGRLYLSFKIG